MATVYSISYNVSTGRILTWGPLPYSAIAGPGEATDVIPDGPPDPKHHRYDGTAISRLRRATPSEMTVVDDADQIVAATAASRHKDTLATIAWVIRARDVPAWTALTLAQKRAAVLAAADDWRDLRIVIERMF